jgi:sulfonate transport system permease protein
MTELLNTLPAAGSVPTVGRSAPSARAAQPAVNRSRGPVLSPSILTLIFWVAPVFVLIVWETLVRAGQLSPHVLPAPSSVIATAIKLIGQGRLLNDMATSLLRAATGFAIGGMIGFTLGTTVGFSKVAQAFLAAASR